MKVSQLHRTLDRTAASGRMRALIEELYPICRSITGDGLRRRCARSATASRSNSTKCRAARRSLDWTVPDEWNITDAYVRNARRTSASSTSAGPTCTWSTTASRSARAALAGGAQDASLHPAGPAGLDSVPDVLLRPELGILPEPAPARRASRGEYEAVIESRLEPGALTYGELYLPGETDRRGPRSRRHCCHPSLANDNLSGIALARQPRRAPSRTRTGATRTDSSSCPARSARSPGSRATRRRVSRIRHGLVVACVGDAGPIHYKKSRRGRRGDRPRRAARAARAPGATTASSSSPPTATTSASTARPASTCRSEASRARRTAASPSTTRRPTISPSCAPRRSPIRCRRTSRCFAVLEGNAPLPQHQPEGRAAARQAAASTARSAVCPIRAATRSRCSGC